MKRPLQATSVSFETLAIAGFLRLFCTTKVGSLGRAGGGRPLSENPDQILESTVRTCSDCGTEIAKSEQQLMERYDKIDMPPMAPLVTRVERYGCRCPQCGAAQIAAVSVGMELGSPFGKRLAAFVPTMRYSHGRRYGTALWKLASVSLKAGEAHRDYGRRKVWRQGLEVAMNIKGSQGHTRVEWVKVEHPFTAVSPASEVHAKHNEAQNSALRRRASAYRRRQNLYAKRVEGL